MDSLNHLIDVIGAISIRVFEVILLFFLILRILLHELREIKGVLSKIISYLGNVETKFDWKSQPHPKSGGEE